MEVLVGKREEGREGGLNFHGTCLVSVKRGIH